MKSVVHQLQSVRAPLAVFGTRQPPPGTRIDDPAYWEKYDNETLIYDSVFLPEKGQLRIFLPKPFNFGDQLRDARFLLDGRPAKPRWSKNIRVDVLEFSAAGLPTDCVMELPDTQLTIRLSETSHDRFLGRNVLYTMVHNDNLTWIRDWILAHVRNHGTDAVLIANNNSSAYSSAELAGAMAEIPGLAVADVLEVPLKYGPTTRTSKQAGTANFLQPACLNIVRDRFLAKARAVLACDVDELVFHPDGCSIYDATVGSVLKYKTFRGSWRYAPPTAHTVTHADHILADARAPRCHSKYCIVPDSFFGRMVWAVHSLEHVNRRIFRPMNAFQFFHCRSISTSWKIARDQGSNMRGQPDPVTCAFMRSTFTGS
jgi:hypothetical protein